jgi:catechol 2,3-dioxygenase-like lactoylglutathione lyase family enzyme
MAMADIKGVAHFSIPVSDVDRSTKFYTDIVGCKFLSQTPDKGITFLDAGGVCLLLIRRPAPIVKGPLEMSNGVHHAFMVDAAEYQGAVDGLRASCRDPEGQALEFINRTAYAADR